MVVLCLFILLLLVCCLLIFSSEPLLPGDDVLRRLILSGPLRSVCFLPLSVYLVLFSPTVFVPGLFLCKSLYLVTTAGFVADQLIM